MKLSLSILPTLLILFSLTTNGQTPGGGYIVLNNSEKIDCEDIIYNSAFAACRGERRWLADEVDYFVTYYESDGNIKTSKYVSLQPKPNSKKVVLRKVYYENENYILVSIHLTNCEWFIFNDASTKKVIEYNLCGRLKKDREKIYDLTYKYFPEADELRAWFVRIWKLKEK